MSRTRITALAASLLLAAAPLSAQSAVAGKWATEFELGLRNIDGVVSSMGTGRARITLEVKGDSVFGTWLVLDPAPTNGPASRALKGVFANGTLTLETDLIDRRLIVNDEEKIVQMRTRYELKLEGESLVGTIRNVSSSGGMEPPPRPFKATREP